MERFRPLIAQLESFGRQWDEDYKEAVYRFRFVRDVLLEIAQSDMGWAGERARRALVETETWYI